MASVVFAVPGTLFVNPTNAATGGTAIVGVEENTILLVLSGEVRVRRNGVGPGSGIRSYMGRVDSAQMVIPLRDMSVGGLKLQFAHATTDGLIMRSTGGTANKQFTPLPTTPAVVRPGQGTQKHLFSQAWAFDEGAEAIVQFSDLLPQHEGASVILIANKLTDATGPDYAWAAAASIDSIFGL